MRYIKWIFISLGVLILVGGSIFVGNALFSLDWEKVHSSETLKLPLYDKTLSNGLVRIKANNLEFRARIAGLKNKGPAILMLHGFPETSAMWEPLIKAAGDLGYRAAAFDQRGYSPGARLDDVSEYEVKKLVQDVIAVADALGFERFHLVGHDWGSAVGWFTLFSNAGRVISWSSLSVAHPASFEKALKEDPEQKKRSSYFLLFRTPFLPELMFTFNDFRMIRKMMQGVMPANQFDEYLRVLSEPGALTGGLNWYRAMDLSQSNNRVQYVKKPVLFIWGNKDKAIGRVAIDAQKEYIKGPYKELELDAGHWLIEEKPKIVVKEILSHIGKYVD